MANDKVSRPQARLPKGFRDIAGEELREMTRMLAIIREVYERYGYEPLETPAFEYTDALGKFLPDQDRPNAGVFSQQDEDEQWMSLRYDMTAPLARYVAENKYAIPTPYRRYTMGPVWRNEKPGPGRFRQFMQCDADTVGTENVAADAEACMLMADVIEALGVPKNQFKIKLNNRKLLDGLLEGITVMHQPAQRLTVLRAIDKLDRLGPGGVSQLLGEGRRDESGDFTPGAKLASSQIKIILAFVYESQNEFVDGAIVQDPTIQELLKYSKRKNFPAGNVGTLDYLAGLLESQDLFQRGVSELREMVTLFDAAGFSDRISVDTSVVRGLDYYTGPVFEAELTFDVKNDDGETVRFGSVGGGGRYDDLVARFTGQRVPATGFSLGLSRLQSALAIINKGTSEALGPVVVLVMDKDRIADYQRLTQQLRQAGIRAEMYLGTSGMKPQMKYADRRRSPCVVIQGSDEKAKGEVQIKDLIEGAKAAAAIKDNKEWKAARPAQTTTIEANMVATVRDILARYQR